MDDLVRWFNAQLDEDERIAREAAKHAAAVLATAASKEGVWEPPYDGPEWENDYDHVFVMCDRPGQPRKVMIADCGHGAFMLTPHIAAHDPARVLREIDAKRQLLALYVEHERMDRETFEAEGEHARSLVSLRAAYLDAVRHHAAVYEDRPGYREAWRP